jgi:ATP-dependent Lon protease
VEQDEKSKSDASEVDSGEKELDREVTPKKYPEQLPLVPLRDVVAYPAMIIPLFVGRESSINAVTAALDSSRTIFIAAQQDITEDNPTPDSIYRTGIVATVLRNIKLPDGRLKVLLQGNTKASITSYVSEDPMYVVEYQTNDESPVPELDVEAQALLRSVKDQIHEALDLGKFISEDVVALIDGLDDPGRISYLIASNLGFKVEMAQQVLETDNPIERLRIVNEHLDQEIKVYAMQAKIESQAKEEMSKTQREYFLREQLRAIQGELGELDTKSSEIESLRSSIEKANMPKDVAEEALLTLKKFEMMHPDNSESSILRTYLDWLIDLPWHKSSTDNLDLKKVKQILDEDHYNLIAVKDRILEHLGVMKLNPSAKGPILCFVGPPGVGKTSLGRSIARAMERSFVRISLGGVKDEAEIRGHRRTYLGALPGRIIQGLKQAGTNNPVFMLDEIDKIGSDFRGDPASALLEVLDPEQNFDFSDHYISLPFDLSHVMFITTANSTDTIPAALFDRMEVLRLPGYIVEEKFHIARRFLIPKQIEGSGLKNDSLSISDTALKDIIRYHTREAGLRNLERMIASISRKVARKIAEDETPPFSITASNMHKYLGAKKFLQEIVPGEDEIGISAGLAWTPYGGEILHVEAMILSGNDGKLILTGHMGDVMKESARIALSCARSKLGDLDDDDHPLSKKEIHLHVPAGAIPKDGPSAGITMCVSLISAISRQPVYQHIAMTGELTLRGKILPVGGIKEKAISATRAGITIVVLPVDNRNDVLEIPKNIRSRIKFHFVSNIDEVLDIVLVKPSVNAPNK